MATGQASRSWFKRRRAEHEDRALSREDVPAAMLVRSLPDGEAVTPTGALSLLDVFAAVRRLSDGVASMPLVPYRKLSDGTRDRASGQLADLLDRPSPGTTQGVLVGTLVAHLATHGNAFIGKVRTDGVVTALVPLAPDRVAVSVQAGEPVYVYSDVQGRQQTLSRADICHARTMSLDGLVGLSPIRQARQGLAVTSALADYSASFWANDARPSGLLKVPQGLNAQDAAKNLAAGWQERHGGPRGAGRVAVLTGDITWEAVSLPPQDAAWVESQRLSTVAVARLFGIPAWCLNADAGGSLTYSNVSEQLRALVSWGLRPYMSAIEQAVSADDDLCVPGSGLFVEFLADALLRSTPEQRAQVYATGIAAGYLTVADVRRAENLPPLDEPPTSAAQEVAADE